MRSYTPLLDLCGAPGALRALADTELGQVAAELRSATIEAVSRTGGHLGAGLGVVELTVALHAVFDTPRDQLIWDVGHQCYPHKILTGRRADMARLRQGGGISGFTKRSESRFDPFGAGHSSTSISAALGLKAALDADVIAVIGDGALSAGMAYEALNNAASLKQRLFVILNDNAMSIAPPTGAMADYLRGPCGPWFEALGFAYHGPIDGHDLHQLLPALRDLKANATGPVLLHVITEKGKGYPPAEAAPDKGHSFAPFDIASGVQHKPQARAPSYTSVFAKALIAEAKRDEKICAITAAMPDGTGLDKFAQHFPARSYDVGIAEQHAVTFAAGLAAGGMKPFCALYSTFLQRAYDQVVHDVALQGLPVRFAIDRAGLVGADGASHAGAFDIAYLANLPGFTVMAPADEGELMHMVATAAAHEAGPIAFRYPRGAGLGVDLPEQGVPLEIGRGRIIRQGADVAILSFGARLAEVLKAGDELAQHEIFPTIADARFAKPLDRALILSLAATHGALITIEEGALGGFGTHVAQLLAEEGVFDGGLKFRPMTLPDRFIPQASPYQMYDDAGLNAAQITGKVLSLLYAPTAKLT